MGTVNATNSSEKQMVMDYLEGKKGADRKIYDTYANVLFAICMRYAPNEDVAQDMFQESFVRIYQKLKDFRFEGSLEGWVKRLCVNQCLDAIRKIASFREEYLEDFRDVDPEISESVSGNLDYKQLLNMLLRLPVGYRTVFNMYVIEGFSHAEIANLLNISESTSKTQLFKARKQLQEWIKNER
jgi:RNA polymerase sigma-70 factor (ECF subfamily)